MQKYVIDGKFIPEEIKENEVILCEMRESDDKTGIQKVGWYKDGEPLFQYKVGEQISIKYVVWKIRKKMGYDIIETLINVGYRLKKM